MTTFPSIHIGTCAWSFDQWRGVFYPYRLPAGDRLSFFCRHLNTVEIDSTFYSVPATHVCTHWAECSPPRFLFSAKLPRELTHERALRDSAGPAAEFFEALRPLGPKLASVLIQLPPYFTLQEHEHSLRDFLRHLPSTSPALAVEFRDPTWHTPRIAHLLEEHGAAWVWNDTSTLADSAKSPFGFWPRTAWFLYVRLLGDLQTKYAADGRTLRDYRHIGWPRDSALESWAEKIRATLPEVQRVLVYCNNHYEGFSPATAMRLAKLLGVDISLPTLEELSGAEEFQLRLL